MPLSFEEIRKNNTCLIIAEAGVNHNGSLDLALKLVDAACEAGCDCIKFQTYITEDDVLISAETAAYQKEQGMGESQYEMLKRLELSFDDFRIIKKYCDDRNILFLSTAFELKSLKFLDEIGMPFWKIPSSDIDHYPYLVEMAKTKKPIIMSTGLSTMEEIEKSVKVLRDNGCDDLTILHCNTAYPTPYEDVSLRAMDSIRERFSCDVGYSDHTEGIEVSIAAAALGAKVIEKHFTLDRNMEGPDHKASIEPNELKELVKAIRHVTKALGSPVKEISNSAKTNSKAASKSIVSICDIKKGELFTERNIACKRPGSGIEPMKWPELIGRPAKFDYLKDEFIFKEELE